MAETVSKQLQDIVDGVARSGALTPDAIRQFDELRKRCESLDTQLTAVVAERDAYRKDNQTLVAKSGAIATELETSRKRVSELEALRAEAEKSVWVAKFESDRRQEMRSILSDVFRNVEVRREMIGNAAPSHSANPNYYPPSSVPVSENVKTTAG